MRSKLNPFYSSLFIIILFNLSAITTIHAQKGQFKFTLGLKVHQTTLSVANDDFFTYIATSPEIGLTYKFKKNEHFISLNKSSNFSYGYGINSDLFNEISPLTHRNEITELDFFYHLNKNQQIPIHVGLGYYSNKYTDIWSVLSQYDQRQRGLSFSIRLNFQNINIIAKKHILIYPYFDVLESNLYSFSVSRNLNFSKAESKNNASSENSLYPFVSLRSHLVKYYWQAKGAYNPIGVSPGIGLAFFHKKSNLEFFLSRDYWVRLTGGLYIDNVVGWIMTNNVGAKYSFESKNKKYNVGLFYSPIYNKNEFDKGRRIRTSLNQFGDEVETVYWKDDNILGIGTSIAMSLNHGFDLEFRQIFPVVGDHFFNIWYSSLGVVYRIK